MEPENYDLKKVFFLLKFLIVFWDLASQQISAWKTMENCFPFGRTYWDVTHVQMLSSKRMLFSLFLGWGCVGVDLYPPKTRANVGLGLWNLSLLHAGWTPPLEKSA